MTTLGPFYGDCTQNPFSMITLGTFWCDSLQDPFSDRKSSFSQLTSLVTVISSIPLMSSCARTSILSSSLRGRSRLCLRDSIIMYSSVSGKQESKTYIISILKLVSIHSSKEPSKMINIFAYKQNLP